MKNISSAALSYDEMTVLNNVGINVSLKDAMNSVLTQVVITRDKTVKVLLLDLNAKLKQMTEEEWEDMQRSMPFEIAYMNEDHYDDPVDWNDEDMAKFDIMTEQMEKEGGVSLHGGEQQKKQKRL